MRYTKRCRFILLQTMIFACSISFAQNTNNLFSLPELSIVSNSNDDTGQLLRSALFYIKDTIINDTLYLEYHNHYCGKTFYRVENNKVYQKNLYWDVNETLLYDFGLNVGDTMETTLFIHPGGYMTFELYVKERDIVTYLDGRERIRIKLGKENSSNDIVFVEGIGQVNFNRNIECVTDDTGFIIMNIPEEECNSRLCKNIKVNFEIESQGKTVQLINNSDNYDEIEWVLGDGTTYYDEDVEHSYQENGCWEITLIAKNSCGIQVQKSISFEHCSDSLWVLQNSFELDKISMQNQDKGFGITKDSLYKTTNGGKNWSSVPIDLENGSTTYRIQDLNIQGSYGIILVKYLELLESNILITNNHGEDWIEIPIPNLNFNSPGFASINSNGNIIIATYSKQVFLSKDFGVTWSESQLSQGISVRNLFQDNEGMAMIVNGEFTDQSKALIHMSYDYGQTFELKKIVPGNNPTKGISFINETGYFTANRAIFKTNNYGQTWFAVDTFYKHMDFEDIVFTDANNGVAITRRDIYRTTDGGASWNLEFCNNNNNLMGIIAIDSTQYIYHNNGISKYEHQGMVDCTTNTNSLKSNNYIEVFPNPFRDEISVKSSEAKLQKVILYSSHGNIVYSEHLDKFQTSITLTLLPSGIYILKLLDDSGNEHITKVIKI